MSPQIAIGRAAGDRHDPRALPRLKTTGDRVTHGGHSRDELVAEPKRMRQNALMAHVINERK